MTSQPSPAQLIENLRKASKAAYIAGDQDSAMREGQAVDALLEAFERRAPSPVPASLIDVAPLEEVIKKVLTQYMGEVRAGAITDEIYVAWMQAGLETIIAAPINPTPKEDPQ